ncbi:hypothetical protein FSP39_008805 [Pinctada imbricata]|uniref:Uncharacterized protein n=1 Tax=Pinctada imbricata TaxID=66713 RepID=A0AA88YKQ7_PINIB|nr:hypothetical protein FSP39_008805 [Pinctada imbricata]
MADNLQSSSDDSDSEFEGFNENDVQIARENESRVQRELQHVINHESDIDVSDESGDESVRLPVFSDEGKWSMGLLFLCKRREGKGGNFIHFKETKVVEEPLPASPVVKREKPELVTRSKRKLTSTLPESHTKIGNINIAVPTFPSPGTIENELNDNLFSFVYDSDSSIHSSDVLLSVNEKLSSTSSEEQLTARDYPILQRKESRMKYRYSAMHGAGDYPDMNESNKENVDVDSVRKEGTRRSKMRREPDMADFFGSYVGYLNKNNSHNVTVSKAQQVIVDQTKKGKITNCINGTFKSESDTRVAIHQAKEEDISECPKSVPVPSRSERKDMVFRKPLHPITIRNLNDIDLCRSPFITDEGKDEVSPKSETSSTRKPQKQFPFDMKLAEQEEKSTATTTESPLREVFPTGYLSSLTQSEHLSPFVKAIAAKYQLLNVTSGKDSGNPEAELEKQKVDIVASSKDNLVVTEEVQSEVMNNPTEKLYVIGDFQENESKIETLIKRYKEEVADKRQKYCSEKDDKEIAFQTPCPSIDASGVCVKQSFSDEERLKFERDLEENLLIEMEAYESFIKEETDSSEQDVLNTSFVSDDTEEMMIKPRSNVLWVSPAKTKAAIKSKGKGDEQIDLLSKEANCAADF